MGGAPPKEKIARNKRSETESTRGICGLAISFLYLGRINCGKFFILNQPRIPAESCLTVVVKIPAALRQYTGNKNEVHVEATTVDEALSILNREFPGLKPLLLDESRKVRPYVNIFVNENSIRVGDGLMTKLKDGDQLHIIPSVAGGSD